MKIEKEMWLKIYQTNHRLNKLSKDAENLNIDLWRKPELVLKNDELNNDSIKEAVKYFN